MESFVDLRNPNGCNQCRPLPLRYLQCCNCHCWDCRSRCCWGWRSKESSYRLGCCCHCHCHFHCHCHYRFHYRYRCRNWTLRTLACDSCCRWYCQTNFLLLLVPLFVPYVSVLPRSIGVLYRHCCCYCCCELLRFWKRAREALFLPPVLVPAPTRFLAEWCRWSKSNAVSSLSLCLPPSSCCY